MGYVVIKAFTDLQDGRHEYHAGDSFPRTGAKVSQGRLDELSGKENKRKTPLIKEIKDNDADGSMPDPEKLVRPRKGKVARKNNDR